MRVGVIAFLHESNTFISRSTTLDHFRRDVLLEGRAVRGFFAPASHEVGGFFAGLDGEGLEAVPIFAARAAPFGTVAAETFQHLVESLLRELERAGRLDGLLLAPHGAMVSESHSDGDGHWMARVRERVGPGIPVVATVDPHANLSRMMVDSCDALIAYRTNPHLDQRDRGLEAAGILSSALRGESRPTQAACFPPLALGIDRQSTAEAPCSWLADRFDRVRSRPGVLSCSLLLGFPYADVAEMGGSAVVVTDGDLPCANLLARELGREMWDQRGDFVGRSLETAEAVALAARRNGPVCLLDMGDNVGGGSPGDGTCLLHEVRRQQVGPTFACVCDPQAVRQAERLGVGGEGVLLVGGKTDSLHGPPFEATFYVEQLADGRFEETATRHGGAMHYDQGRTAIVRTAPDLTLMLTSHRVPPFSLRQVTHFGLRPERFRLLVVKGVNAPLAAYREVCDHFLRVDTPGVTTADMRRLRYRRRRRPMYPFETSCEWTP